MEWTISHGLAAHHHDSINSHFSAFVCVCSNTHYIIFFFFVKYSIQYFAQRVTFDGTLQFITLHCIRCYTLRPSASRIFSFIAEALEFWSFLLFRNKKNKCCKILCHGRIFSQESADVEEKHVSFHFIFYEVGNKLKSFTQIVHNFICLMCHFFLYFSCV